MNRLDQIIADKLPTVMVPAYENLAEIKTGASRFLMARNGLYIEAKTSWGHLLKNLWQSPRPLPYGNVSEVDTFRDVLLKNRMILEDITGMAAKYAREGREWAGFIAHTDCGFQYVQVVFDSTAAQVKYKMPELPEGATIAVDIHSHGRIPPYFSDTDNKDDAGGVKIAVVLGNYRHENGHDAFDAEARYCIEGIHIDVR